MLGGEFSALLLVLVLLSYPEVWLQSKSRLGVPCRLTDLETYPIGHGTQVTRVPCDNPLET